MKRSTQIIVVDPTSGGAELYPSLSLVAREMYNNDVAPAEERSILSYITKATREGNKAYGFTLLRVPGDMAIEEQQLFIRRTCAISALKGRLTRLQSVNLPEEVLEELEAAASHLDQYLPTEEV